MIRLGITALLLAFLLPWWSNVAAASSPATDPAWGPFAHVAGRTAVSESGTTKARWYWVEPGKSLMQEYRRTKDDVVWRQTLITLGTEPGTLVVEGRPAEMEREPVYVARLQADGRLYMPHEAATPDTGNFLGLVEGDSVLAYSPARLTGGRAVPNEADDRTYLRFRLDAAPDPAKTDGVAADAATAEPATQPAEPLPDPSMVAAMLRRVIEGMQAGQLPADDVTERLRDAKVLPGPRTFGAVRAVRFIETAPNRSFKFEVDHANVNAQWQVWLDKSGDLIDNVGWELVPRQAAPDSQPDGGPAIQAGTFDAAAGQEQVVLAQTGGTVWMSGKFSAEDFRRQADGNFYFADTNTNLVHGLKVVDPVTVELFTPGHPDIAPERYVRRYGTGEQRELEYGYFNYLPERQGVNGLVIRLDGDRLTTATATYASDYRRQPDGTFHYFDANGRATHGLRIVNARAVDIYQLPETRPSRLIRRGDAPADYIANARTYSDRMARENDRLWAIREAELAEEERAWEEEMAYEEAAASNAGANIMDGFMRGLAEATATNRAMEQSMEDAAARGLAQGAQEYARRQAAEAYDEGYDDSYDDGYGNTYDDSHDSGYDSGYDAGGTTQGVTPATPAVTERACEVVTKRYTNRSLPKPSIAEAKGYLGQLPSLCALGAAPTQGAAACTEDSEPVVTRDEKGIPRTTGRRTTYTCEAVMTCPAAEVCQSEPGGGASRQ